MKQNKCIKCGAAERDAKGKCKACARARVSAWRAANPEKKRAADAAWYATAGKDPVNIEKRRARDANWYAENADKKAAYQAANPSHERRRINNQNRRARESGGRLSKGIAERLLKLQRGKCACGCKQALGTDYHIDHVMPLALGGTNTDDNIQLLRQRCNNQKHAKHPVDFMRERGFLI